MRVFSLLVLAGTLAIASVPAQAGSVRQATSLKKISITSAQEGPFTVTGHPLCPSGQAETQFAAVSRTFPDGSLDLAVTKHFTCDDGSGTFDMLIHVRLRLVSGAFTNNFRWLIIGGTGLYEHLEGFGTGVGVTQNGEAVDLYTGRVGSSG